MTYVVGNKDVVIADKYVEQKVGGHLLPRKNLDKQGFFELERTCKTVKNCIP